MGFVSIFSVKQKFSETSYKRKPVFVAFRYHIFPLKNNYEREGKGKKWENVAFLSNRALFVTNHFKSEAFHA